MENRLSTEERQQLLQLARQTIDTAVATGTAIPYDTNNEKLCEHRGCFVTITINGELRGCIGNFISEKPLFKQVQEMAVAASTKDPRFYPMKHQDLQNYQLEISVLSPLQKISSIEEIEVGKHGIYLEKNYARGVLLPQVATEHGWDREAFLRQTSVKAGLKPEDWKEGADIYIFSAEIFNDK